MTVTNNFSNSPLPSRQTYTFIPELNSWANYIINISPVKSTHIKKPITVDDNAWKKEGSILDLLFNYTFSPNSYNIYYRKVNQNNITDPHIKTRRLIYSGQLSIYLNDLTSPQIPTDTTSSDIGMSTTVISNVIPTDSTSSLFHTIPLIGENIFNITYGEKDLLDLLHSHKNGNTIDLSTINFNNLPSNLSKLIYSYLKVEVDQEYTFFSDIQNLTTQDDRLITQLYEKFVIDHYYMRFKLRPSFPKNEFEPELLRTDSTSSIHTITKTEVVNKQIEFSPPEIPYGKDSFYVVYDSVLQSSGVDYDYILTSIDSTSVFSALTWNNKTLYSKINEGDIIYLIWGYVSEYEDIL